MMKRDTIGLSVLFMILAAMGIRGGAGQAQVPSRVIITQLRNFDYVKNRAYSLYILGIDMLLNIHADQMHNLLKSSPSGPVVPSYMTKMENRGDFRIEEAKSIRTQKSFSHFTLVSVDRDLVLCGLDYSSVQSTGNRVRMTCENLMGRGVDDISVPARVALIRECGPGEFVAFNNSEPSVLSILDGTLQFKKRVSLNTPLVCRNVWKMDSGQYLVFHLADSKGRIFSVIDADGKIIRSLYPIHHSDQGNLRRVFLDSLYVTEYKAGRIYVTLVFPKSSELVIDEIEVVTGRVHRMAAGIRGYPRRSPRFEQTGITSTGSVRIAAVNGMFAVGEKITVSVAVNDKSRQGEYFTHYLFVFCPAEKTVRVAEIPSGAVVYYDRNRNQYLALKDRRPGEHHMTFRPIVVGD